MIAFVRGRIASLGPDQAVMDVGGVGLSLHCTPGTLAGLHLGEPAELATSLVVREDSMTLYGFADEDERVVFELLQTASGVGPRLAQAMLAVHSPDALRRSVAAEDIATLTRVPGIGKKGAQRIILELKDRLGAPVGSAPGRNAHPVGASAGPSGEDWQGQVHAALLGLGWSAREADQAVVAVAPMAQDSADIQLSALLKAALRTLTTS